MRILSLNCQKEYRPELGPFLERMFADGSYDFILLQEATDSVLEYVRHASGYAFLTALDELTQKRSMLCIVYRSSTTLISHEFHSFAGMRFDPVEGYRHLGFGLLAGLFSFGNNQMCIGSTHLHSGIDSVVRVAELKRMKDSLLRYVGPNPVIVGGDYNFGYPWELSRAMRLLEPEMVCETRDLGGTLDSRYSEYVYHLPNKIAFILGKVGLGVKLKTDHFFVSSGLAASADISCRILPDRVSDHSPIELLYP